MNAAITAFTTVFRRELATVVRTPVYGLFGIGLLAVLAGFVVVGGGGGTGFVPAVVDLLLPTEVLVPLLAVVLGYRALLTDTESGELAVIRTYPVSVGQYVAGVLVARLVALLAIVGVSYGLVGVYVWLTASPDTAIFATHAGVDSPLLFVRFVALAAVLGAAYLFLAAALSTFVSTRRSAIGLAVIALVGGVLGGDLLLLRSLAGGTPAASIPGLLALTPNGAFRGLVFEYVVGIAFAPDGQFVATARAVVLLVGWLAGSVAVAVGTLAYGEQVRTVVERAAVR